MGMLRWIAFILISLASLSGYAQLIASGDSLILLKIIGEKVCIDKKGNLSFSYYYENISPNPLIVLDYYDPCIWENPHLYLASDSLPTLGLVASIKNDLGEEILPVLDSHSLDSIPPEKYRIDSLAFYEVYEPKKTLEYLDHTRVLKPQKPLINFFSLKPNKRKCFLPGQFTFDPERKYTIRLFYLAHADAATLINHSTVKKEDHLFVGKIMSNEVELCFEKK
jgi:hypothetical protein